MEMEYRERVRERETRVDLLDYWRVIVKRKGVIFTFAGTLILLIGIYSFTAPPKFKPTTTMLIGEETSKVLSIEDEFGLLGYSSQMRERMFINTQLILLKSESLAERVARKMNLLSRTEFGGGENPKKSIMAKIKDLVTFKWIKGKKKTEENDLALIDPYSKIIKDFQNQIDVSQIRDTKVLKVSYTSPHPILATEIVNTLAEEFITFSIEKRYETTQQATDFLSDQIANLREELAAKERELQRYGKEKELFFLSDTESAVISKFGDLNSAFTQAQIDRVKAQTTYRALKDSSVDSLPRTVENRIIQNLEQEYTNMKNEYEEKSKIYKPDFPEMVSLKAKLDSMREELRGEIKKAVDLAEQQYQEALKKEYSFKSLLDNQKAEVARMNSNAILYNSIKIEVENKRKLLNSLVERQNETLVSARLGGLKTSNISIIDRAKVPEHPVWPKKKLNLILAVLMGIFGGVGLCFVFEYFDNTVKGPEDVEKLAGLPSLGVIPFLSPEGMKKKGGRSGYYSGYRSEGAVGGENLGKEKEEVLPEIKEIELVNHLYPRFSISEDYRTVRSSILLSHAESPPKTIAFTSGLPMEGKTATAANMAVAFSQLEKRVLIVDADLRKPRMHRLFKVRNVGGGLSGYLTGKVSIEDVILKTDIENLWIIPSGLVPPNPAELLDSNKMKLLVEELKKVFDVVLFDTPPVLAVVDAKVVGSLADSVVLIVQPGKTTRKPFLKAADELRQTNANIIGVLFNQMNVRKGDYYYMDYYYNPFSAG